MPKLSSDELRTIVRRDFADQRKLGELISAIKVHSKTKVSLWLAGKYKSSAETLERDIRKFLLSRQLCRRDELILTEITVLLNRASNRDALIAAIATSAF